MKTLFKNEELVVSLLPFKHPPGFKPKFSLIAVTDEKGLTFTNVPESASLALDLVQVAVQTIAERLPRDGAPSVPLFAVDGPQGIA